MNPEGGSRVRRSQRVIDRVRAKAEWIVWLLSLSLCLLFCLFHLKAVKQVNSMRIHAWLTLYKCDLSERIRFDIFVEHFVCLRFVLLLLWMMFILLSSWHLIPIASRNFAT